MLKIFFLFIFLVTSVRGQDRAEGDSCIDEYTNTIGRCTARESCQSAKDLNRSRIQLTFCPNNTFGDQIICCPDGNIFNTPSSGDLNDRPIWGIADDLSNRKRVSERKCEEYSRSVEIKVGYIPLVPEPNSVVESNCENTGVELIVGGTSVKPGEFPHMAAIGWMDIDGNYTFICAGSLISPRYVLTVATCNRPLSAQTPESVIVRLGDQNIDNNVDDGADPIDVAIHRIHLHPDYISPKMYYDIALLELVADVKFGSAIRPACLWTQNDLGRHRNVIATGWGFGKTSTKDLNKLSLPILDVADCNITLRGLMNRNWRNGFIDSQMCVEEVNREKDSCLLMSGSTIQVVKKENSCIFYAVGFSSFARGCKQKQPVVYTRVSSFVDWIESIVWPGE